MNESPINRFFERDLHEIRVGVPVLVPIVKAFEHLVSHHVEDLLSAFGILYPPEIDRIREQVLDADLLIIPCNILRTRAGDSGDLLGPFHPIRIILLHGPHALIGLHLILHVSF